MLHQIAADLSGAIKLPLLPLYGRLLSSSAFTALTDQGRVVSWGGNGWDSSGVAAKDRNVRLTTWGTAHFGGDIRDIADVLSADVVDIVSRDHAFANLKKNGRVVGWGDEYSGGDARLVQNSIQDGVVRLYSPDSAFSAVNEDGTIIFL